MECRAQLATYKRAEAEKRATVQNQQVTLRRGLAQLDAHVMAATTEAPQEPAIITATPSRRTEGTNESPITTQAGSMEAAISHTTTQAQQQPNKRPEPTARNNWVEITAAQRELL
jgi:hypothetical protein